MLAMACKKKYLNWALYLLLLGTIELFSKTIYFIAPSWGDMFSLESSGNRDDSFKPTYTLKVYLETFGFSVANISHPNQAKNPYKVIWFDISPKLAQATSILNREQQILFIWEPRVMNRVSYKEELHTHFSVVYTWDDSLLRKDSSVTSYKKFYYPQLRLPLTEYPEYSERKLLTMINRYATCNEAGELKSERLKAAQFFDQNCPEKFDLYGVGWPKKQFKCYRGQVKSKDSVLPLYRFTLCYENTNLQPGYISEKILDAFHARCVPIYLGAQNVEQYIPNECFIDMRNFSTYPELLMFLENIDSASFQAYLNAAYKFMTAENGQKFSSKSFIQIVLEALEIGNEPTETLK